MAQKQILLFFLRAFDAIIENTKCQMTLKAFHEKKNQKERKNRTRHKKEKETDTEMESERKTENINISMEQVVKLRCRDKSNCCIELVHRDKLASTHLTSLI